MCQRTLVPDELINRVVTEKRPELLRQFPVHRTFGQYLIQTKVQNPISKLNRNIQRSAHNLVRRIQGYMPIADEVAEVEMHLHNL